MISSPESSEHSTQESQNKQSTKEQDPLIRQFCQEIDAYPTPEEKIAHGLKFMRESISQEGSPRFREFWEVRKLVLPYFKENLNPAIRSNLWDEYIELTVEARRLKEILEEQSAFAMEQIDLAIKAMENDLANFATLLEGQKEQIFENGPKLIEQKTELYHQIQTELNLLNTLASRLNSLRKEVARTDMRIRFKTKFFKRLSELGDQIFPKRKELIEKVSEEFEKDVQRFVDSHFKDDQVVGAPFYVLKEEIKALQSIAKVFTLNSQAFTNTRLKLSKCWDQIKQLEKEHRQRIDEKREAFSENRQKIEDDIAQLKEKSGSLQFSDLKKEINQILKEMRDCFLTKEEVRTFKKELEELQKPFLEAEEAKAKEIEAEKRKKQEEKRAKIEQMGEKITSFIAKVEGLGVKEAVKEYEDLKKEIADLQLSRFEKQEIDRKIRPLQDAISEKEEEALLNLSEDDKKALENYQTVLDQKKKRRQEIKGEMEVYRKTLGGSNLDFEKAMEAQELFEEEKLRLESIDQSIDEIEEKIRKLKS